MSGSSAAGSHCGAGGSVGGSGAGVCATVGLGATRRLFCAILVEKDRPVISTRELADEQSYEAEISQCVGVTGFHQWFYDGCRPGI